MNACFRNVDDDASVMALTGNFDVYASPYVKRYLVALFGRGRTRIVVNLERVTYIDSTGLGVLIESARRAQALGGTISIVTNAERMKRLFESLGLQKVFSIFDEQESAIAASLLTASERLAVHRSLTVLDG